MEVNARRRLWFHRGGGKSLDYQQNRRFAGVWVVPKMMERSRLPGLGWYAHGDRGSSNVGI